MIRKLKKHRVRIKRMQIKRCKKTKKKMLWNQKRMKCQTILKRERKQREKNRLRLIEILNQSKIQMKCGNCTLELKRKEIRKKLKLKRQDRKLLINKWQKLLDFMLKNNLNLKKMVKLKNQQQLLKLLLQTNQEMFQQLLKLSHNLLLRQKNKNRKNFKHKRKEMIHLLLHLRQDQLLKIMEMETIGLLTCPKQFKMVDKELIIGAQKRKVKLKKKHWNLKKKILSLQKLNQKKKKPKKKKLKVKTKPKQKQRVVVNQKTNKLQKSIMMHLQATQVILNPILIAIDNSSINYNI